MQVAEHFPFQSLTTKTLTKAVSTTEPWSVANLLLDKRGSLGELVFNGGYQYNGRINAAGVSLRLRDQLNYGLGVIFPLHSRVQGIVELYGHTYIGPGANPDLIVSEPRPAGVTGGIRINATRFVGINLGYRYAGNAPATNYSGFILGLSFGPAATHNAPSPPPTLACQVSQSPVLPGTPISVRSIVSPAGKPYTYTWTSSGGRLASHGAYAVLNSAGMVPGLYTVTGHARNARAQTTDCTARVEIRQPPRHPPVVSCLVSPISALPGVTMTLAGSAYSPDHRPLRYSWAVVPAGLGRLDTTTQATAHLDTTGARPGAVIGRLTVTDDRGLSSSCSAQGIIQMPPPPQASLAATLPFQPGSSLVINIAKVSLDDVALRLQQDASPRVVIVGLATDFELRRRLSPAMTLRLAEERAVHAKYYLVKQKGIASGRIEVRHGEGMHTASVWIVPQGATFHGPGADFNESVIKR